MIKGITIALALIGLCLGVWAVATSRFHPPSHEPVQLPSINPYAVGVAATGVVETASPDVKVAAPEPGLIAEVYVQVNDRVAKGDPLFQLDRRTLDAQQVIAAAAIVSAQAQLDRLAAMPRPEDLVPLRAAVRRTQVELDNFKDILRRTQIAYDRDAATEGELVRCRFVVDGAAAAVDEAEAQLKRIEAGAWDQEIKVAQAAVEQAKAQVEALRIQTSRLTVLSPIDGVVLKRLIEPGEFTGLGAVSALGGISDSGAEPAMIVGDLSHLLVRAHVDEMDMHLVRSGAQATARLRGAAAKAIELKMVRIEPLAQPKRQLAGTNVEFVDTRVIEILFDIESSQDVVIYPGQLVDVFIDVSSSESAR